MNDNDVKTFFVIAEKPPFKGFLDEAFCYGPLENAYRFDSKENAESECDEDLEEVLTIISNPVVQNES